MRKTRKFFFFLSSWCSSLVLCLEACLSRGPRGGNGIVFLSIGALIALQEDPERREWKNTLAAWVSSGRRRCRPSLTRTCHVAVAAAAAAVVDREVFSWVGRISSSQQWPYPPSVISAVCDARRCRGTPWWIPHEPRLLAYDTIHCRGGGMLLTGH